MVRLMAVVAFVPEVFCIVRHVLAQRLPVTQATRPYRRRTLISGCCCIWVPGFGVVQ